MLFFLLLSGGEGEDEDAEGKKRTKSKSKGRDTAAEAFLNRRANIHRDFAEFVN